MHIVEDPVIVPADTALIVTIIVAKQLLLPV